MKIPKYEKDRTLTRRTVKGAAGGMKGVDYEDDRRADPATKLGPEASQIQKLKLEQLRMARNEAAAAARAAAGAEDTEPTKATAPKEEQEMILDDEDATSRDTKAKQKRRAVVARDRFTVDKDAPDRRRNVRWDLMSDEDDPEDSLEEEIDSATIAEAIFGTPRAGLFDLGISPGAPGLWMPEDIQRAFNAPLDYAKHCMLLAETFAESTGAARDETIRYLAALYLGCRDVRFARRALLSWGPDTGILDIYPLEVIEFVLEARPAFLPKVRFGRWIAPELGESPQSELTATPDLPLFLTVPEDVAVRGFAIKGGGRPGYCFEPGLTLSSYALTLGQPGVYPLLMSARTEDGELLVDRLTVRVLGTPPADRPRRERNAERIAAWPMPEIPDRIEDVEPEPENADAPSAPNPDALAKGELARRQRLDAMGGPKGEQADPIFGLGRDAARTPLRSGAEARPPPMIPLEAPEDVQLSVAEAAVLRLALAAGATMADVQIVGADPSAGDAVTEVLPIWPDTAIEPTYDAPAAAAAMAELAERALADAPPARLGQASTEEFAEVAEPAPAETSAERPRADKPAPAGTSPIPPAPFTLTSIEMAAGPPTLPEVPSTAAPPMDGQTIADAPAVVGRPEGVVSGTQAQVPGEGGPTARIDLVADLWSEPPDEETADDPPPEEPQR